MMKVKALKPWSNGEISMEQYEVRDLPDALAQNLIDAGIVVEIGGGSGGGVLVVKFATGFPQKCDHTYEEIKSAYDNGLTILAAMSTSNSSLSCMNFIQGQHGTKDAFDAYVANYAGSGLYVTHVKIDMDGTITSEAYHSISYSE